MIMTCVHARQTAVNTLVCLILHLLFTAYIYSVAHVNCFYHQYH